MDKIASIRALNQAYLEKLTTPGLVKEAQDETNDFIRTQVRERGIYRRVIPMKEATDDMLTPQVDTDLPVIVEEMQPDSPAAVSVPFRTLPSNWYVQGKKFRVTFSRIQTPQFQGDVDVLRTWKMDIRQVISDQASKDIMAEEDRAFISALNNALGTADTANPITNVVQWETIYGGITVDTVLEARAIMMKTPSNLAPTTVLLNQVTANQLLKLNAVETSDNLSEQLLKEGVGALEGLFSIPNWIVTIKRGYVPDDSMYFFADPEYIGRSYSLTDVTMVVKVEGPIVSWWFYETVGGTIANVSGLARADFA